MTHFADPIKQSMSVMFGVPVDHFYDVALKESPLPGHGDVTPRAVMTWVNDVVKPRFGRDFFAKSLNAKWRAYIAMRERYLLVPDVRFPEEADYILNNGGKIIFIRNPRLPFPPNEEVHESEWTLHPGYISHIIQNDGTIADLGHKARLWVAENT